MPLSARNCYQIDRGLILETRITIRGMTTYCSSAEPLPLYARYFTCSTLLPVDLSTLSGLLPFAAFFQRTVLSALLSRILATWSIVIVLEEPFTFTSLHSPFIVIMLSFASTTTLLPLQSPVLRRS